LIFPAGGTGLYEVVDIKVWKINLMWKFMSKNCILDFWIILKVFWVKSIFYVL
jgi:hypothetical protein